MQSTEPTLEATVSQRFTWEKGEAPRFTDRSSTYPVEVAVTGLLVIKSSHGGHRCHWGGFEVKKDGTVGSRSRKGAYSPKAQWFKDLVDAMPTPVASVAD